MKDEHKKDSDLFGLGGFIEKLVDLAGRLQNEGEIIKEGRINLDHLKKDLKGVYGVTIKTAAGSEKPFVETFGNIKRTPDGPKVEEEREPIVDVFNEKDEIVVIAEMPGIGTSDILIDVKEDMLDISAKNSFRKYHKAILLPLKADKEKISSNYHNGLLELKIKK